MISRNIYMHIAMQYILTPSVLYLDKNFRLYKNFFSRKKCWSQSNHLSQYSAYLYNSAYYWTISLLTMAQYSPPKHHNVGVLGPMYTYFSWLGYKQCFLFTRIEFSFISGTVSAKLFLYKVEKVTFWFVLDL